MSSIWDSDEDIWSGVDLQARIMEEFEQSYFNNVLHRLQFNVFKGKSYIDNAFRDAHDKLYQRYQSSADTYNNERRAWILDLRIAREANDERNIKSAEEWLKNHPPFSVNQQDIEHLWHGYRQRLEETIRNRDINIERQIEIIVENKGQQFTKRDRVTLLQFYKALLPQRTIKKEVLERDADEIYIGSQSLLQWYNIYLERLKPKPHFGTLPVPAPAPEPTFRPRPVKRLPKPKPFKVNPETRENIREEQRKFLRENRINIDTDDIIPYPFKSKIKEYKTRFPNTPYQSIPDDPKVESRTRKLEKPYFSPEPHSWEIDLVFNLLEQGDIYLFCININTKYLVVYKVKSKAANDVLPALEDLRNTFEVKSIKGDGERSFAAEDTKRFWQHYHIKTYFSKTKFTNHNRIVDSVIRTIRNAIGYRNISEEQLEQIINYYNNTKHSGTGFTPVEMMEDIDKEFYFIRKCNERLIDVKKRLPKLKQGNVVIVHLELGKVAGKFEKKRLTHDRLGVFQEYIHGNCRVLVSPAVQISSGSYRNDVLVPEYCVKYVADSIDTLDEKYKRRFYSDVFIPMVENQE